MLFLTKLLDALDILNRCYAMPLVGLNVRSIGAFSNHAVSNRHFDYLQYITINTYLVALYINNPYAVIYPTCIWSIAWHLYVIGYRDL